MQGSASWRITEPLRFANDSFPRLLVGHCACRVLRARILKRLKMLQMRKEHTIGTLNELELSRGA